MHHQASDRPYFYPCTNANIFGQLANQQNPNPEVLFHLGYIPLAIEDYVKNFLDVQHDVSYKAGYAISPTY